jgi:hypothetical protein
MHISNVVAGACALAVIAMPALAADNSDHRLKGAEQYHLTDGPKLDAALTAAITKADRDLFDAVFIQCDAAKVAATLTDDFRFVHDKDGASTRAQFVDNLKGHCDRVKTGVDFPARRELVAGSMQVWPINHYGALEIGVHRFYATLPGKPEQLTENGNFMILWKNVDGQWRMAESFSYGHALAQ